MTAYCRCSSCLDARLTAASGVAVNAAAAAVEGGDGRIALALPKNRGLLAARRAEATPEPAPPKREPFIDPNLD